METPPLIPVRRLHNFVYCPRLFYFQWVEALFEENEDTAEGDRVHKRVDVPSIVSKDNPVPATSRSYKVSSEKLGIVGVADLIDAEDTGLNLVEYKKGAPAVGEGGERVAKDYDAIQVGALALLLEEDGRPVSRAGIYYAAEKAHVEVGLTEALRARVLNTIREARALAESASIPPPLVNSTKCLYCSAYPICLPNESRFWADVKSPETISIKEPPRPKDETGETLIIQDVQVKVGVRAGKVMVFREGAIEASLPLEQLKAVYLYGPIQISAQAIALFLENEIDVSYFSRAGRFLGLLQGLPASGPDARRGQYRLCDESAESLRIARECIRAKIHNQRVLLMRNGSAAQGVLKDLVKLRDSCESASAKTELMGFEGAAAAIYFREFGSMIGSSAGWAYSSEHRNRRPPRDPLNALLSLGYSLLAKELTGICHSVGVDPFVGFLHATRYGRPALALDLMEEFRPLIVDSVAISLLNRGELEESDFQITTAGTFLKDEGRRVFWESYFRRMETEITHPQFGYVMSYRRMLEVQVRQFWRFCRGEAASYQAFTTR